MGVVAPTNKPSKIKGLRVRLRRLLLLRLRALAPALVRLQLLERVRRVVPPLPGEGHEDSREIFDGHRTVQIAQVVHVVLH